MFAALFACLIIRVRLCIRYVGDEDGVGITAVVRNRCVRSSHETNISTRVHPAKPVSRVVTYETAYETDTLCSCGKVFWPCNANRSEHAGKKQKYACQHTRLFARAVRWRRFTLVTIADYCSYYCSYCIVADFSR